MRPFEGGDGPPNAPAGAPTPRRATWPARVRTVLLTVGVPVAAFLLVRIVLGIGAKLAGFDPFARGTWARFDSWLYLSIVHKGYVLVPCTPDTGYGHRQACGNAGWFPLLPGVVKLLSTLGLRPLTGALVAAAASELSALMVFFRRVLGGARTAQALGALLLFAAFPGFVYRHAAFPVSAFVLGTLLTFVLVFAGRWRWAALTAFLTSFTHGAAQPLFLVWGLAGLLAPAERPGQRWRRALGLAGAAVAGIVAVHGILWASTGVPDAFFRVTAKYHTGLHDPFATLLYFLRVSFSGRPRTHPAVALQIGLVAILVVATTWLTVRRLRRRSPEAWQDVCVLAFVLGLWALPYVLGKDIAIYRAEAFLAPSVLVLRRLPPVVLWLLAIAALAVGAGLGNAFFRSQIV